MDDVLGYKDKHVLVSGAASGMGAATTELLVELGARVTALDVKPVEHAGVAESRTVDLKDKASIDEAVAGLGPLDAVFSVAGLPGPPFSHFDVLMVNFIGARHLIESVIPSMPEGSAIACVASTAALGWEKDYANLVPLISTDGFDAAVEWVLANPDPLEAQSGYLYSKKMMNAWVALRSGSLLSERGIRLNNTNPGPTQTPMMPAFEDYAGAELVNAFVGPSGRRSTPEEQAWPLLFLNSPRASYVAGLAFQADAGFNASQISNPM